MKPVSDVLRSSHSRGATIVLLFAMSVSLDLSTASAAVSLDAGTGAAPIVVDAGTDAQSKPSTDSLTSTCEKLAELIELLEDEGWWGTLLRRYLTDHQQRLRDAREMYERVCEPFFGPV